MLDRRLIVCFAVRKGGCILVKRALNVLVTKTVVVGIVLVVSSAFTLLYDGVDLT